MQKTFCSLLIAAAFSGSALAPAAFAKPAAPAAAKSSKASKANEAATARLYAALVKGPEPKLAELAMFMTQLPKGGDLHHHYSGAIYAEQYLEWVGKMGYCVNKISLRIETDKAVAESQKALKPAEKTCLSTQEVLADDFTLSQVLQKWSSKDFYNHSGPQLPPDRTFFDTFGYFGPVSNDNFNEGLQVLKRRAIDENVAYIETMFKMAPPNADDAQWDAAVLAAPDDAALTAQFKAMQTALDQDQAFTARMTDFVNKVKAASAGIDDDRFTMRYQTYVLRLLPPSQVFSSMVGAFKSAQQSGGLIVGVNIVGQESQYISMRDYTLHMKMFQYLHALYPDVKLALHAGELSLGMVPPEGMKFHIQQAVDVAGASRIGHGIDLAYEADPVTLMKTMKDKGIAVEINLTSNGFINGVSGANHPITLYRKFGVPYVISTDDAGVTRHTLSHEYVLLASRYQPDYAEVKRVSYNSIRHSFLAGADKQRLLKQLDARFATFEAAMAKRPH
ncbi:adenosine deaminase [Massilia arenosa]|uniref:adenosine deaminase n=1 Tax=Zemynaea arenosa TaxID=2561931 RepID=A0A4Y9SA62_9BURK|nr:adenosine deaminase [Massilia arenosa]TFW18476.1 adenosine deaminase [Massilia arenosa]